jgi:rubrerythrin
MELYTHVLQKTGVLKTFTVAKIVKKKDIEDLKKLIKEIASDENEYKTLLEEELIQFRESSTKQKIQISGKRFWH